jgi:LacI family transcriptional regulator
MRSAGLEPLPRVAAMDPAFPDAVRRPDGPTALITFQHRIAVNLLEVLWRRGIRVPQDLSIATFNNAFPVEHTIPPLTVVSLPTREMGRRAAEMLLERIERPGRAASAEEVEPPAAADVLLEEELIVRESTAPPRTA